MSFYYFKNLPLNLNGNTLMPSDIQLQSEVNIIHPYKYDERTSAKNVPNAPNKSTLKIKYYCTGSDFIKPYLYALEHERLTGNLCNLVFTQGYVSDYAVTFTPNIPIQIDATIEIYDKISGTFTPASPINQTGLVLRTSDITLNNSTGYTTSLISNMTQASFTYSCKLNPSYFYDSGIPITRADRVSIEDRKWDIEVISDSVNFDIPLSGQNFGLTISGTNPYNNQIGESFSASGVIYQKELSLSSNKVHSHILRLSHNNSSTPGNISGVIINANSFNIYSTPGTHPFTNQSLNIIDKILVYDTICSGFSVTNQGNYDVITVPTPANIINGPLTIYSSKGNFIWPSTLNFSYPSVTITGVSQYTGYPGATVYISGTNFYRISQVNFGGVNSTFQINSPTLILSVVPPNGQTADIQLISDLRSLTGYTSQFFCCQPSISILTPVTGVWGNTVVVGGLNFSGTTGVFFGTGMVKASGFNVVSNSQVLVNTPATGVGFSAGYVTVLTSGGSTQSYSSYNPQVPIYSFNPTSGIFLNGLNLSMIVDSGYLCPTGGGYKIRFGGIDTVFFQNGTGLTGTVPFGAQTDYIYIYQPDGVSTYTPNASQYTVHSAPEIYSITPAVVNQYQYFNPVLIGENFEFFTANLPYFYMFSGGINNDTQTGSNITANSGGNADTLYIQNLIITGSTGYYSIIVQNFAGTGIMTSGLRVNTGINQASTLCRAVFTPSNQNQIGQNLSTQVGLQLASYAIDASTGSYAGMKCTLSNSGVALIITPKNNNLLTVNLIKLVVSNIDVNDNVPGDRRSGPLFIHTTTGAISMWYKNANQPFFYTQLIDMSLGSNNVFNLFNSGVTGVASVRVHTPAAANNTDYRYLGINELQVF